MDAVASSGVKIKIQLEDSQSPWQSWSCGSPHTLQYEQMVEKMAELFPAHNGSQSRELLWKDSDGDLVTVSSDEELQHAFSNLTDDHLELVIRAPNARPQQLTCEACERSSQYNHHDMYMCVRCPHYVLCQQCKLTSKLHSHHPMVHINPVTTTKRHSQTMSSEEKPQSTSSEESVSNTQKQENQSPTMTSSDSQTESSVLSSSERPVTSSQNQGACRQRTKKRRMQKMVEQCRKGVLGLDIKRATSNTAQDDPPRHNADTERVCNEDEEEEDEELDRMEAQMEEWLRQNWDLDTSPDAEPPWKQMMRRLHQYWHGDKKK